jgi:hypothetical protein
MFWYLPAGTDLYTVLQQGPQVEGSEDLATNTTDHVNSTTEQNNAPLIVQLQASVSLADAVCAAARQDALEGSTQPATGPNSTQQLPLLADMQPIFNLTYPLVLTGASVNTNATSNNSNTTTNNTVTSPLPSTVLDLAAVPHVIALTSPNASLTLQHLSLFNPPPGPPSTYPLGLSTLMTWTASMDRSPQTPGCSSNASGTEASLVLVQDCALGLPDEGG